MTDRQIEDNDRPESSSRMSSQTVTRINWIALFSVVFTVGTLVWQASTANSQLQEQSRNLTSMRSDMNTLVASVRTDMSERVNGVSQISNERLNSIGVDFTARFRQTDLVITGLQSSFVELVREVALTKERLSSQDTARRETNGRVDQQIERMISSLNIIREQINQIARAVPRSAIISPQQSESWRYEYQTQDRLLMAILAEIENDNSPAHALPSYLTSGRFEDYLFGDPSLLAQHDLANQQFIE